MYRILDEDQAAEERRDQLRHPHYQKPELLATAANQVWSWDITKLLAAQKWTYYYLYVILDVFSRYVVGWMLARRESSDLARRLIRETLDKSKTGRGGQNVSEVRTTPFDSTLRMAFFPRRLLVARASFENGCRAWVTLPKCCHAGWQFRQFTGFGKWMRQESTSRTMSTQLAGSEIKRDNQMAGIGAILRS